MTTVNNTTNTTNNTTNNFVFEDTKNHAFEKLMNGVKETNNRLADVKAERLDEQREYSRKLSEIHKAFNLGGVIMSTSDYARQELLKGARLKDVRSQESYLRAYLCSMEQIYQASDAYVCTSTLRYLVYANVFNFFLIEQGLEPVDISIIDEYFDVAFEKRNRTMEY